jgi:adenylosuccinate synthase
MHFIIGLGYGDEGKGSLIDALSRRAAAANRRPLIIRHNGGPQAAHFVVTDAGQSHCFAQLGAGMLVPQAATILSQYMLIDPPALLREAEALAALGVSAPLSRLFIDERCVVVTPFHKLLNRMQEVARGDLRHGSCGLGVGQAWLDSQNPALPSLRIGEARDEAALARALRFLQMVKLDQAEQLVDRNPAAPALRTYLTELRRTDWTSRLVDSYRALLQRIALLDDGEHLRAALKDDGFEPLFEGAQGVLLDAEYGFWPHVTPSHTTYRNALQLLLDCRSSRTPRRLGVLRAYATRHGAGPFVTQDAELESQLPERHNVHNPWQGEMRVGWFDAVAARYALEVAGGCDGVALSNLDRLSGQPRVRVCVGYRTTDESGCESIIERLPRSAEPNRARQAALATQLLSCQPIYKELPGWEDVRLGDGLSPPAEAFVRFLESPAGLATPIPIVSCGATASGKIFRGESQDRAQ